MDMLYSALRGKPGVARAGMRPESGSLCTCPRKPLSRTPSLPAQEPGHPRETFPWSPLAYTCNSSLLSLFLLPLLPSRLPTFPIWKKNAENYTHTSCTQVPETRLICSNKDVLFLE